MQPLALVLTGNRCGHDPMAPRYFVPPAAHRARASVLEKAKGAAALFYAEPLRFLRDLRLSPRQARSERRESVAALLQAMLHYVDLASLKVGIAVDGQPMRCLTIKFLAAKAGLGTKRAWRALRDLAQAGYIAIERRYKAACEKGKLSITGLPAVKTLSIKAFTHLGIEYHSLVRHREYARKLRETKRRGRAAGKLACIAGQLARNFKKKAAMPFRSKKAEEAQRVARIENERTRSLQALEFYKQGHTLEEVSAMFYPERRAPSG